MFTWKVLHVFSNSADAAIFLAQLDANDIPHVEQDYTSIFGQSFYSQSFGGIKVLVPEDKYDDAKRILDEYVIGHGDSINDI